MKKEPPRLKELMKQANKESAEKRKHPADGWDTWNAWIVYGRQ